MFFALCFRIEISVRSTSAIVSFLLELFNWQLTSGEPKQPYGGYDCVHGENWAFHTWTAGTYHIVLYICFGTLCLPPMILAQC